MCNNMYWRVIPDSAAVTFVWDAFKSYFKGQYLSIIAKVRRGRRADLTRVEAVATRQEALYVRTRDSQQYTCLQSLTQEAFLLWTNLTQKQLLH